jgi:hypothetical protein
MTKQQFFKEFEAIKSDKVFITDSVDNMKEEIKHNCWSISMGDELAKECSISELSKFLAGSKVGQTTAVKTIGNESRAYLLFMGG